MICTHCRIWAKNSSSSPEERLAKIEIDETLRDAVRDAQRMPGRNEALRRQMQYIGKLMRGADPAPIRAALDAINGVSRAGDCRAAIAWSDCAND